MTAALAERSIDHGTFSDATPEVASETTSRKRGIRSWNNRFGAWVKAHPRLAVVLFIAL